VQDFNPLFIKSVLLKREHVPSFSGYPFHLPAIATLTELSLKKQVTFLVGENGSGKSTILEGIAAAYGFNPEGGTKNFNFSTYKTHSCLEDYLTIVKGGFRPEDGFFMRAESFYNVATKIDELGLMNSYGGKSLHEQSHGESFLSLFLHKFRGNSLYLLDEPEAALSPARQMTMLARMHQLVLEGCQFIIATHSPIIMAYPNACIYELDENGYREVLYEETEHYQMTKSFLEAPERMLRILMDTD